MSGCMSAFSGMPTVEMCAGLKQLKDEHILLLKELDDLFLLTEKVRKEEAVLEHFELLIKKVIEFKLLLDPHSEREEGVLFPMMGVYIGTTSGPIAVMEYDHEQAKGALRLFLEGADKALAEPSEMQKLSGVVQTAYHILTDHFAKEENVLFPMAERMFSDEEKEEFYRKIQLIS